MRALLVCAGLVIMSACGTANTQPVPPRDSVEADSLTVLRDTSGINTQEGGTVYTADVRQRLGVVAGPADPPASLTGSPGTGTIVRSGATPSRHHPHITDEAARGDVLLVLAGEIGRASCRER